MQGTQELKVKSRQIGILINRAIQETDPDDKGRWTQLRLAGEVGISKDMLNRMIHGRAHIEFDHIAAIAKALNVGFDFSVKGAEFKINTNGDVSKIFADS